MYLLFSRKLIEPVSVRDINPDLEGEVTSFPRKISQQRFFYFLLFILLCFSSLLPREVERAGLGFENCYIMNFIIPPPSISIKSFIYLVSEIQT